MLIKWFILILINIVLGISALRYKYYHKKVLGEIKSEEKIMCIFYIISTLLGANHFIKRYDYNLQIIANCLKLFNAYFQVLICVTILSIFIRNYKKVSNYDIDKEGGKKI